MQRIFYAANPDPVAFWTSTFDEVLLVIQGFVDRQRVERRNAHLIHCSMVEKPVDMFEYSPLPYDDELKGETGLSDGELYNLAKETGYFENQFWAN